MLFSSLTFICIFLPAVYITNIALKRVSIQNVFLLMASLFFYAWGETVFVFLMVFSALMNYLSALAFSVKPKMKKLILVLAIIGNLVMLGIFKYTDFFISLINQIFGTHIPLTGIALPIGISFFTFQAMSYVIDVYHKETEVQRYFTKLLLYISFFPQLVAGPIIKYHDISKQLDERSVTLNETATGIRRFIVGLSKKLFLANTMGAVADRIFAVETDSLNILVAWLGAVAYVFQIFFDFSGYSDMAIGLGLMFGFRFRENFNYPYVSQNIQEFWRRWHVSLSTWFKEYLYIPLGGNKKGGIRTGLNKVFVFLCTGLWHGANWTFVIWGLWHGLFIMLESYGILNTKKWPRVLRHCYLLMIVTLGFVMFRAETVTQGMTMIQTMFSGFTLDHEKMSIFFEFLKPSFLFTLVICIIASTEISKRFNINKVFLEYAKYAFATVLFVLCMLNLSTTTFNPFIYFRF